MIETVTVDLDSLRLVRSPDTLVLFEWRAGPDGSIDVTGKHLRVRITWPNGETTTHDTFSGAELEDDVLNPIDVVIPVNGLELFVPIDEIKRAPLRQARLGTIAERWEKIHRRNID